MTWLTKYPTDVLDWRRQPSAADQPTIWRVVDGKCRNSAGITQRFCIQEIAENRYEDVLDFMSNVMLQDEPTCASLNIANDPDAIQDSRKQWSHCLQQGISVGAFLVDAKNPKPILAGVNLLWVKYSANESGGMTGAINLTSKKQKIMTEWMNNLENEINVRDVYNIDKYISGFGLCVDRPYRGQGLAYHLLNARQDISVAYDIPGTLTIFTSLAAQKVAANVGFEVLIERNYADLRNEEGEEVFPAIVETVFKLMGKRF